MRASTIALSLLILGAGCGRPEPQVFPQGELVDLSHAYDAQTIYWPTAEGFRLRKDAEGVTAARTSTRRFTSRKAGTRWTRSRSIA
jgi:hypothetical protein